MLGNDHWTLELDALGMEEAGDELARWVLTCRPPYAVCVQGKWGSGKTSLMRYAMARLGGEPLATLLETRPKAARELPDDLDERWRALAEDSTVFIEETVRPLLVSPPTNLRPRLQIIPIWFNPWQHQGADQPVVALLHELRQQLTHLVKLGSKVKKLSQVAVESSLPILGEMLDSFSALQGGPKTGLGKAVGGIRQAGEAYERRHFETVHDAQRLNLLFRQAVDRLLARRGSAFADGRSGEPVALRRLVIFIDDLDRCAEAQTVRLLEAIKLYLQTPNCVFIFGMDVAAARRAVCNVHSQGDEVAREYLEKLFQATLRVPLPRASAGFVERLLEHCGLSGNGVPEPGTLAAQVLDLVEPNPRKIKGFVSHLAVGWRVYRQVVDGEGDFPCFLLASYLAAYHPDVFRLLSYEPSQVERLHRVILEPTSDEGYGQASPVDHFFKSAFRHALPMTLGLSSPVRQEVDPVVKEVIERLDRLKGDRAFRALWRVELGALGEGRVAARFSPILGSAVIVAGEEP